MYVCYGFDTPVEAQRIRVETGLPRIGIDKVHYAHVEVSFNGRDFTPVPEPWVQGACEFVPQGPVHAVRLVFEAGNRTQRAHIQDIVCYCLE